MVVEAPTRADWHGDLPRRDADEARCRTGQSTHRMGPGRYRDGRGKPTFTYALNRKKLRRARRREGVICCAPISPRTIPTLLWPAMLSSSFAVEQAFKNLKQDLAIRPVFHQDEHQIEAHIFIAFLAYCLQGHAPASAACPGARADRARRSGEIRSGPDDRCHLPTADGRELLLTRYTQPEPELPPRAIEQLKLSLPPQPPPRIAARAVPSGPNNPV